jgi:hypothetical protein
MPPKNPPNPKSTPPRFTPPRLALNDKLDVIALIIDAVLVLKAPTVASPNCPATVEILSVTTLLTDT